MLNKLCAKCGQQFSCRDRKRKFCGYSCANSEREPLAERFARQLASPNERGCILWNGSVRGRGNVLYGDFSIGGRHKYAHRFAWEAVHGAVPDGLVLRHSCDEPRCCNVEHLSLGTNKQNTEDIITRGRRPVFRGDDCPVSKLRSVDVVQIRALAKAGVLQIRLAERFGVKAMEISRIVRRQRWAHIP